VMEMKVRLNTIRPTNETMISTRSTLRHTMQGSGSRESRGSINSNQLIETEVRQHSNVSVPLRDVEDSFQLFSGSNYVEIDEWLDDFEEKSIMFGWNELYKFIYCKQLLRGEARMFVRSQTGINSWVSLREKLLCEFGRKLSSIEVHRVLKNRRKTNEESCREYLYALMEIGRTIKIDDESLIEYFVDGISDSRSNKSILYQARSVNDLQEKIRVYEKIKGSSKDEK